MLKQRFIAAVIFVFAIFGFTGQTFAQQTLKTYIPQEDTVTILQNPMMGFQDHDVTRSWWPSSTGYIRASGTCLSNGVVTPCGPLMWDKLNPQKGVYNFADIDLFLDNMKTQKKFAGFRVRSVFDETSLPTVPAWATTEGVTTSLGQEAFGGRSGVEIDYQKCVFLDNWATFVQQLISRYDNNPQISFVDIGGYGWYGEWWSGKTVPQRSYSYQIHDATDPTQQQSWDTRLRIIRMFTGGSGSGHCVDNTGKDILVSYAYQGFKNKPVLVSRGDEEDVANGTTAGSGVRYDAVGAANTDFRAKVGSYIAKVWQTKPIMGEFTNPASATRNLDFFNRSLCFAREYHLSGIHNNDNTKPTTVDLDPLFRELGYRFVLNSVTYPGSVPPSSQQQFTFSWSNKGTAPAYTRYPLILTFKPKGIDTVSAQVQLSSTDIRQILPADVTATSTDYLTCSKGTPAVYTINENVTIPALPSGSYDMYIGLVEPVYQSPIQLALLQKDSAGRYFAGQIDVQSATTNTPQASVPTNTLVPTNTPVLPTTAPTTAPATATTIILPTNTQQPTLLPPTNTATPVPPTNTALPTSVAPTNTALPTSTRTIIEAEGPQVQRNGTWTVKSNVASASGLSYLQSSGSKQDTLSLTFSGTSVEVMYVMGPTLGSINVYVDGNHIQLVDLTATSLIFGQTLKITNLTNQSHVIKVTTAKGTIALDAFILP